MTVFDGKVDVLFYSGNTSYADHSLRMVIFKQWSARKYLPWFLRLDVIIPFHRRRKTKGEHKIPIRQLSKGYEFDV